MLKQALVIAHKEVVDGARDVRSVISSLIYALMGPMVVGLVSLSKAGSDAGVIAAMLSIFTLVAAFVGGMNMAMDTVAGERERRSLLPLLLNPVSRLDIVLGKWMGVAVFGLAGFLVNVLASGAVLRMAPLLWLPAALGILPLPLLAAAIQLLISTVCRNVKEAQTYLSLIVFLPMGLGMLLVFFPAARQAWCSYLPIVGQELQLELLMKGGRLAALSSVLLGCLTVSLAAAVLRLAANRLEHDEIIWAWLLWNDGQPSVKSATYGLRPDAGGAQKPGISAYPSGKGEAHASTHESSRTPIRAATMGRRPRLVTQLFYASS